jgi:hypothetical protein
MQLPAVGNPKAAVQFTGYRQRPMAARYQKYHRLEGAHIGHLAEEGKQCYKKLKNVIMVGVAVYHYQVRA